MYTGCIRGGGGGVTLAIGRYPYLFGCIRGVSGVGVGVGGHSGDR